MASSNAPKLLEFMMLIGKLKHIKRTGWIRKGITDPESIAGHMYRMAIMALLLDKAQGLDISRCLKLAVVHDMGECIVGDLTPWCGVSKEEKHRREKAAMEELQNLVGAEAGREIYGLWEEYEAQNTPEAKVVKDFDRFDMILQAYEYEQQDQVPHGLQEFFDCTLGKFQDPSVKEWVDELYKQRAAHRTASS